MQEYQPYIRYAIILVLGFITVGLVSFVQWAFALDFSEDELEKIFWTCVGLLGITGGGAVALHATKSKPKD